MFLVHCQSIIAKQFVEGVEGNPVIFQWTVNQGNQDVASLAAYLGDSFDREKVLVGWSEDKPNPPSKLAQDLFQDRLTVDVTGKTAANQSVTYQLKLDKVRLNESGFIVYLQVQFSSKAPEGQAITLSKVKGIRSFLSFFVIFLSLKT